MKVLRDASYNLVQHRFGGGEGGLFGGFFAEIETDDGDIMELPIDSIMAQELLHSSDIEQEAGIIDLARLQLGDYI